MSKAICLTFTALFLIGTASAQSVTGKKKVIAVNIKETQGNLSQPALISQEPNMQIAEQWWPDLTDYWTPVGWKHHRFRYNVFFDGTIYADPSLSSTAKAWAGQGLQLKVEPYPVVATKRLASIMKGFIYLEL